MALDLLDRGEKLSCFLLGLNCRFRYKWKQLQGFRLKALGLALC